MKKIVMLILVALCAILLVACVAPNGAISEEDIDHDATVVPVVKPVGTAPEPLRWSKSNYSDVHIVSGGLAPSSQTVQFDLGFNTLKLKAQGYTYINVDLSFSVFINKGLWVNTMVNVYLSDAHQKQFAGFGHLVFKNTKSEYRNYDTKISIDSLQQARGTIFLTFKAVKNSFQTGTYISNITLTMTAE